MAYLIRAEYYNGDSEIVPIWSTALLYELEMIERDNPNIEDIHIVGTDPTEEECNHFAKLVKLTKYRFPKEYKKNRRRTYGKKQD